LRNITTILSVESSRQQIFKCQALETVLCSGIATAWKFIDRKFEYYVAFRLNFKSIERIKKRVF